MEPLDGAAFADLGEGLDRGEVHLWLWRLDDGSTVPDLGGLLDDGERARAERYLLAEKRRTFVAAHGLVRVLLGGYLETSPADLAFETNEHGKPRLRENGPAFNLAHSGGHILLGMAAQGEIGVDVEQCRHVSEPLALAEKVLGGAVVEALWRLEGAARDHAFLDAWTRMEARSKALGGPFSPSADELNVLSVDLGADCRAAVARRGTLDQLRVRTLAWSDAGIFRFRTG